MPRAPRLAAGRARALGVPTRGTTGPQRLRRVDRWLLATRARLLQGAQDPLVVDLGYGATAVTTVELADRLADLRPGVEVLGLEIDPERVAAAQPAARPGLGFARGGFELPVPRPALVVRAMNVLRQYDEAAVLPAWQAVCARLAPDGVLVEGTCDELGRRATWLVVGADAEPRELVLAARLGDLGRPSELAERLPKALIHRNVPGERVHAFLTAWDDAYAATAALAPYGPRARFVAAAHALRDAAWPLLGSPARWRHGELTVAWSAVCPGVPAGASDVMGGGQTGETAHVASPPDRPDR